MRPFVAVAVAVDRPSTAAGSRVTVRRVERGITPSYGVGATRGPSARSRRDEPGQTGQRDA